jgi:hypothetical protein
MNDLEIKRSPEMMVETRGIDHMKKVAIVRNTNGLISTIVSDEGPQIGGEGSAPAPLMFFSAGIAL